jgi:antitoxin component of MazEF toxin-antitoxin module
MNSAVAKVRKIGNSKGILFPKSVLNKSGIKDTVKITVKNKIIMISATDQGRKKQWSDFKKVVPEKVGIVQNKFDQIEWTW